MFTVVICDERIIEDCKTKYRVYLKPFLEVPSVALCAWNPEGETLDEAVPELADQIYQKKEWRAVVVTDSLIWDRDTVCSRNPFDYVGTVEQTYRFADMAQIRSHRAQMTQKTEKAIQNPLTKLAVWLCGAPLRTPPIVCYEEARDAFADAENVQAYTEAKARLGLTWSEIERDMDRERRYLALKERFEVEGELFNPPQSVVVLSERMQVSDNPYEETEWVGRTEYEYSAFARENLYPEKLRYMLCDILYKRGVRNEHDYFKFLTLMLMIATQECPQGMLRAERVYRLEMKIDIERLKVLCAKYNSKLWATIGKIDDLEKRMEDRERQPLDAGTAQEFFESDIKIPIDVVTKESRSNLKAKTDGIGLAYDCPDNDYTNWDDQYHTISKYFVRFLREPRRAVKSTVKGEFRRHSRIEDERALQLSEFQKEDVRYVLDEEEHNMVSTATTQLFNTARYTKKMEEADREIRKNIACRMTKAQIWAVGIVALVVYLLGFIPLLFTNNGGNFLFSLMLMGIAGGLLLGIGFVTLLILRHSYVKKIKRFNSEMNGILAEIDEGTRMFSKYLSHACNVMREFSVLQYTESAQRRRHNILTNHRRIIGEKIAEVETVFSGYIDMSDMEIDPTEEPYEYDFLQMRRYEFDMPYSSVQKTIDYMQPGNLITIETDYIESITLSREELYD